MYDVVDGVAQCTINNALYAYDGVAHTIHGFARETRSTIRAKLAQHGTNNNTNSPLYLTKGWMYAQLMFWKVLDGLRRKDYYDRTHLMDLLETIEGAEPVVALPRHVFAKLEIVLEEDRAGQDARQPTGYGGKRQYDREEQAIVETTPRKRVRKDEARDSTAISRSTLTPSRQPQAYQKVDVQTGNKVEEEEEAANDREVEQEPAETRLPARGAIWKEQWSKIEEFRRRQRLLTAVGTYVLSCPLIEDRYPGLEGELRLSIKLTPGTEDTGALYGQLDLGLFKGAVDLAVSDISLHVWCYDKTPRPVLSNAEMSRLRARGRGARATLGLQRKPNSSCINPRADVDLSKELKLCGEFRCNDDRKLFLRSGLVFANDFEINFTDLSGLTFTGRIKLPMLSHEPIDLEGFKVVETATRHGPLWQEYDTASVRYGSTLNEP